MRRPGLAGPRRQQRLRPVQHLDLALLIDAQHDGAVGRVQIETDDMRAFSTKTGSLDGLKVCR